MLPEVQELSELLQLLLFFFPQNVEVDIVKVRKDYRNDVNKKSNLTRAVQSSDYKKIHAVIIDSYHTTKVVQPIAEDDFMLQVGGVNRSSHKRKQYK